MKIVSTLIKYSFLLTFIFCVVTFAESEPNNTYQQANVIGPNSTGSGALNEATQTQDADNYDWWQVTLPYDGSLYVEASASGGLTDVELHIYDINGTSQISSLDISTGPKEATHHNALKAGTFYIRVSRYSGSGSYSIQTEFTLAPYSNDSEPNDTYLQALTLAPNSETTGHIGYFADNSTDTYDWWKITIPADGSLKIRTESDSADIELYIYDVNGTSQISSLDISTGINEETHRNDLMAGTYYIRASLYSKHGGYRIISTYTPISIEGITTLDNEQNNTYSTAQNLGTFGTQGSITNYGHVGYYSNNFTDSYDWWSITTQTDGKLVMKTVSNESLDLDMHIYDVNGSSQISTLDISSGIYEQTHRNDLAAGTYYIRVFSYYGYSAYKITAEFTPTSLTNDYEPNDGISTANSIFPDNIKTGHLGYYSNNYSDEYDFYVFTLTSNWDSLYVRTDSEADLEADLGLYDNSSSNLASAGAYGTAEIMIYPNANAGTYYIRVHRWSGEGSYAIKLTNRYPHNPLTDAKKEDIKILPTAYSLSQNYPNPFNPITKIEYALPKESKVKLEVFDTLGKNVATLIDDTKSAGSYSVNFDASKLSSGLYIYRLNASNQTFTKKMLLLK